jgi:hypothetical protein
MENAVPYTADIIKNRISTGIILVFHLPRNEKKQQITVTAEIIRCFSSKEKAGINDMAEKKTKPITYATGFLTFLSKNKY